MKVKLVFLFFSVVLFLSCQDNTKNDEMKLKEKELQLKEKEIELKKREGKLIEQSNNLNTKKLEPSNDSLPPFKQYGFIVMEVQLENENFKDRMQGRKYINLVYTTGIGEYIYLDEDQKYKFLDNTQSFYMKINAEKNPVVNSRRFLLFNSYSEASKAREKYRLAD